MTKGFIPGLYVLKADFGGLRDLQNKLLTSTIHHHLPEISNKIIATCRELPLHTVVPRKRENAIDRPQTSQMAEIWGDMPRGIQIGSNEHILSYI